MVILRIFLFGLLAYVDHNSRVTVLMVDAQNPPLTSDGCPIHPHVPVLVYQGARCEFPCFYERGVCRCTLQRDQISMQLGGQSVCPQKSDGFEYLVDMKSLRWRTWANLRGWGLSGGTIDRDCLESKIDHDKCPQLAARVDINRDCMIACDVDPTKGGQKFEFRPLTKSNFWFTYKQSYLTELILTERVVRVDQDGELRLKVEAFDKSGSYPVSLDVYDCERPPYNRCADIVIANAMLEHRPATGRCAAAEIGRHFEVYQDLTVEPFRVPTRVVPMAVGNSYHNDKKPLPICRSIVLDAFLHLFDRALENRIICPSSGYRN